MRRPTVTPEGIRAGFLYTVELVHGGARTRWGACMVRRVHGQARTRFGPATFWYSGSMNRLGKPLASLDSNEFDFAFPQSVISA